MIKKLNRFKILGGFMKKFCAAFAVAFNVFAYECPTLEAQVFAKVLKVESSAQLCTYKVVVTQIKEHILCPLFAEEIEASEVVSKNFGSCYEEGATFGHILVKDQTSGSIFID